MPNNTVFFAFLSSPGPSSLAGIPSEAWNSRRIQLALMMPTLLTETRTKPWKWVALATLLFDIDAFITYTLRLTNLGKRIQDRKHADLCKTIRIPATIQLIFSPYLRERLLGRSTQSKQEQRSSLSKRNKKNQRLFTVVQLFFLGHGSFYIVDHTHALIAAAAATWSTPEYSEVTYGLLLSLMSVLQIFGNRPPQHRSRMIFHIQTGATMYISKCLSIATNGYTITPSVLSSLIPWKSRPRSALRILNGVMSKKREFRHGVLPSCWALLETFATIVGWVKHVQGMYKEAKQPYCNMQAKIRADGRDAELVYLVIPWPLQMLFTYTAYTSHFCHD